MRSFSGRAHFPGRDQTVQDRHDPDREEADTAKLTTTVVRDHRKTTIATTGTTVVRDHRIKGRHRARPSHRQQRRGARPP